MNWICCNRFVHNSLFQMVFCWQKYCEWNEVKKSLSKRRSKQTGFLILSLLPLLYCPVLSCTVLSLLPLLCTVLIVTVISFPYCYHKLILAEMKFSLGKLLLKLMSLNIANMMVISLTSRIIRYNIPYIQYNIQYNIPLKLLSVSDTAEYIQKKLWMMRNQAIRHRKLTKSVV